jgi:hypothetical protein
MSLHHKGHYKPIRTEFQGGGWIACNEDWDEGMPIESGRTEEEAFQNFVDATCECVPINTSAAGCAHADAYDACDCKCHLWEPRS